MFLIPSQYTPWSLQRGWGFWLVEYKVSMEPLRKPLWRTIAASSSSSFSLLWDTPFKRWMEEAEINLKPLCVISKTVFWIWVLFSFLDNQKGSTKLDSEGWGKIKRGFGCWYKRELKAREYGERELGEWQILEPRRWNIYIVYSSHTHTHIFIL